MKQHEISQSTVCVPCCLVMIFLLYYSQKCYADRKLLEEQHQKSTSDGLECESTQDTDVNCKTITAAPLCVADGCVTLTTISEPSTPSAVTHSPSQVSPPSITMESPEMIAPPTTAIAQVQMTGKWLVVCDYMYWCGNTY